MTDIDDFSDNHRPEDQDPEPGPAESEPRPPMTDAERADHDASMTRLQTALRPGSATRH